MGLGMDEFDQPLDVYRSKLEALTDVGNVFEHRRREHKKRGNALMVMKKSLTSMEMWLSEGCKTEDFAHIEEDKLNELAANVKEANAWLDERQQLSASTPKNADPPFQSDEITTKIKELNVAYQAI